MLTYIRTNILESNAQTVTNTVNTVGVMGKGLASAMKARHPSMFREYAKLCADNKLHVGQLWLWKEASQWVLNFPTKKHWRNPSKLSYIEAGLKKFAAEYERRGIWEIAFPRLGCGNGNLDWEDVRPLMERYLANLPIQIYIHDFEKDIGSPEHEQSLQIQQIKFERSFPKFMTDLRSVIFACRGQFQTLQSKRQYIAQVLENGDLRIERNKRATIVSANELFELWTLMLRGPLTRRKLGGRAHEEAYYLFPILSGLPYIRAIELQPRGAFPMIAVELDDSAEPSDPASMAKAQGELAWL